MRILLLTGGLGVLALVLIPPGMRSGAAGGWLLGIGLEALTLRARLQAAQRGKPLLPALAGGFFARMGLLLVGTLLGAFSTLWSAEAYLVACAAALLLGEGIAFARLR